MGAVWKVSQPQPLSKGSRLFIKIKDYKFNWRALRESVTNWICSVLSRK